MLGDSEIGFSIFFYVFFKEVVPHLPAEREVFTGCTAYSFAQRNPPSYKTHGEEEAPPEVMCVSDSVGEDL